jgi:hypothetical protein
MDRLELHRDQVWRRKSGAFRPQAPGSAAGEPYIHIATWYHALLDAHRQMHPHHRSDSLVSLPRRFSQDRDEGPGKDVPI